MHGLEPVRARIQHPCRRRLGGPEGPRGRPWPAGRCGRV